MRLVDADALLKHETEADKMAAMLVVGKGYILDAPTVEAAPVKRGHWIDFQPDEDYQTCSACGSEWNKLDNDTYKFSFCPSCGADMREET